MSAPDAPRPSSVPALSVPVETVTLPSIKGVSPDSERLTGPSASPSRAVAEGTETVPVRVPGYEILEEPARGGQSAVSKAPQTRLTGLASQYRCAVCSLSVAFEFPAVFPRDPHGHRP